MTIEIYDFHSDETREACQEDYDQLLSAVMKLRTRINNVWMEFALWQEQVQGSPQEELLKLGELFKAEFPRKESRK